MSRFILASFKDDPCFSSQIVMFLAMSAGTEDVEVQNSKLSTVTNAAAKNAHTEKRLATVEKQDVGRSFSPVGIELTLDHPLPIQSWKRRHSSGLYDILLDKNGEIDIEDLSAGDSGQVGIIVDNRSIKIIKQLMSH